MRALVLAVVLGACSPDGAREFLDAARGGEVNDAGTSADVGDPVREKSSADPCGSRGDVPSGKLLPCRAFDPRKDLGYPP